MFLSRSLLFAFSLSVICSNILVYIDFHSVDSHFILFCFRCKSTYESQVVRIPTKVSALTVAENDMSPSVAVN